VRVFAISDVHVDYQANMDWLLGLSDCDYEQDMLLLAGDVSDLPAHLETVLVALKRKFKEVFFVPGNHELWISRCGTKDSLVKLDLVMRLARAAGVRTSTWHGDAITVVPMMSWYDYSFGEPDAQLKGAWSDFRSCRWPESYDEAAITRHFLRQNDESLQSRNGTVISFSHFLPRIDVMPERIPRSHRYLYPVLGSDALGAQVRRLSPDVHVYGHSHVNRRVVIDGVEYVNNAFGYPSERGITRRRLICVFDDEAPV